MSKQMIISVMSQDRPGIIADITGAIYELEGDLADLSQSILFGYLTMILIANFAGPVTPENVIAQISQIKSQTTLDVLVRALNPAIEIAPSGLPKKTYIVTAQGKNRSGLVHGISSFCYHHAINILDLATTRTGDQYTMILQLDLDQAESLTQIRQALKAYGRQSGLTVVMQHHDIFKITNEITF